MVFAAYPLVPWRSRAGSDFFSSGESHTQRAVGLSKLGEEFGDTFAIASLGLISLSLPPRPLYAGLCLYCLSPLEATVRLDQLIERQRTQTNYLLYSYYYLFRDQELTAASSTGGARVRTLVLAAVERRQEATAVPVHCDLPRPISRDDSRSQHLARCPCRGADLLRSSSPGYLDL